MDVLTIEYIESGVGIGEGIFPTLLKKEVPQTNSIGVL